MRTAILPSYVRPLSPFWAVATRLFSYSALIGFGLLIGLIYALLPPQLVFIPASPVLILTILCLWALPDVDRVPESLLNRAMMLFVFANIVWPSYIALSLPGLPWINPQRLGLFVLLIAGLIKLSTSSAMRRDILASVKSVPVIFWSFWIFWLTTVITLPFSAEVMVSVKKWANNQVYWTFLFLLSAYLAQRSGFVTMLARLVVLGAILTALLSVFEFAQRSVFWGPWIPLWLIGDFEIFQTVMSDQARAGVNMYRARSTFTVSITFAEFLSMALPFAIHLAVQASSFWKRAFMVAATLLIVISAVFLTNARSGMNGCLIAAFGYALYAAFRRWREKRSDLLGASAFYMFPAAGVAFLILTFAWQRLYTLVLGSGQHSFSNDAREVQWASGIDKMLANPIGYGVGQSGPVVGFRLPDGSLTIDSYALSVLIEFGVVGLAAFTVLVLGSATLAMRMALASRDREQLLLAPIAIALLAFGVIKTVLSQMENIPLMFVMVGCICGLAYRRTRPGAPSD